VKAVKEEVKEDPRFVKKNLEKFATSASKSEDKEQLEKMRKQLIES
jgi:hypothetical protein